MLSVRRRKSTAECLGRSPGSEWTARDAELVGCFTFPGAWHRVAERNSALSLQWRDRAGFAPDFPVMPLVGTQTETMVAREKRTTRAANDETCARGRG